MSTRFAIALRGLLAGLVTRRLSVREFLALTALALLLGTIYCQVYCLLALQAMHGNSMPFLASVFRAGSDVIPAFLLFEIGKRIKRTSKAAFVLQIVALFAVLLILAVAIRFQANVMLMNLTLRHVAVDRLPFLFASLAALQLVHRRSARSIDPVGTNDDGESLLPPVQVIDWVRAAGNYVELRVYGRTKLLRATLRQTASVLPSDQFIQIHRSVIVNRARIEAFEGGQRVKMSDGTIFPIGGAYRSKVLAA